MNKCVIILMLLISNTVMAQQDAISKFFQKYEEDENFTSIFISGKMFDMISKIPAGEDEEVMKKTLQDLKGLRLLSSENVNGEQLMQEFTKKLNQEGYEELMFIKEKGQPQLQFLIQEENDTVHELLMLSGEGKSFFMLSFIGIIDLNQLSKLSESMEIDGMDQLKKLKTKPKNQ